MTSTVLYTNQMATRFLGFDPRAFMQSILSKGTPDVKLAQRHETILTKATREFLKFNRLEFTLDDYVSWMRREGHEIKLHTARIYLWRMIDKGQIRFVRKGIRSKPAIYEVCHKNKLSEYQHL